MFALIDDDVLKIILSYSSRNELMPLRHSCHYFFERKNEFCSYALLDMFFPLINDNNWQRPDKFTLVYLQEITMKYNLLRQVEFKCTKSMSPTYWEFPFWVTHIISGYNNGRFYAFNIDSNSRLFKPCPVMDSL